MIIKQFVDDLEFFYNENFSKHYTPEQLFTAEQLMNNVRLLAEQTEEFNYYEAPADTLEMVVEGLKEYHDVDSVVELLQEVIDELDS